MTLITRPAYSDDAGDGQSGTIINKALLDAVFDAIDAITHSSTNPGRAPNDTTDEVVTARGSKSSVGARLDVSIDSAGLLKPGGGTTVKRLEVGTVSINPPNIAATTRGTATGTISGLAAGDIVVMLPPSGLNAGLLYGGCYVSGVDTVTVFLRNDTGGAIDDGALTWTYLWIDVT